MCIRDRLAVTQPDKPKGRGKSMQYPPVKEAAIAYGIEVYQPERVRRLECIEYLAKYQPDIIVVCLLYTSHGKSAG